VLAVLFAVLGGLIFGGLPMLVRRGLTRTGDVLAGVVVQSVVALVVCGVVAVARGQVHGNPLDFFAIGLVVPGLSTILMTRAVREAGPTRVSLLMNASPLLSIAGAFLLLREPFHVALVVGAVLIVGGNIAGYTRTMTTTIALETSKGDLPLAVGLGLALLFVMLLVNSAILCFSRLGAWIEARV